MILSLCLPNSILIRGIERGFWGLRLLCKSNPMLRKGRGMNLKPVFNTNPTVENLEYEVSGCTFQTSSTTAAADVLSHSGNISPAGKGYNNKLSYDTPFNLMYPYSTWSRIPLYQRLLQGNIHDVKAFKKCSSHPPLIRKGH